MIEGNFKVETRVSSSEIKTDFRPPVQTGREFPARFGTKHVRQSASLKVHDKTGHVRAFVTCNSERPEQGGTCAGNEKQRRGNHSDQGVP